jgi:hypothetical protein
MRLIGLHGRLQSGKDTAYEIIDRSAVEDNKLVVRHALADALKMSALRSLGLDKALQVFEIEEVLGVSELLKKSGRVTVSWERPNGTLTSASITGRQFLQFYGTESHREADLGSSFGPDFWIDNLLPKGEVDGNPAFWQNFKESWAGFADFAVVTDIRFENEARRILDLGGEVWYIDAEERLGPNEEAHISEQKLPDEYISKFLDNNSTLGNFEAEVLNALADS